MERINPALQAQTGLFDLSGSQNRVTSYMLADVMFRCDQRPWQTREGVYIS